MKKKVLIVDDNEFMLSLIAHILDNEGYEVETSTQAFGLFEHINSYHPNLIILDAQLPDGDGRELCKRIKQSDDMGYISVLMCSGRDDINDCFKQQGPPDGILQKPFDMSELIKMVGQNLRTAA